MSTRVRKRYLLVEVISNASVPHHEFERAMFDSLLQLFGQYGASKADLILLGYDERERMAVIRCNHDAVPMVRTVVASIQSIAKSPVIVRIVDVSGTIKALIRKKAAANLLRRRSRR